ncbi:peptidase S8/S53 domain-containing protein [Lactarius hatsudake]|nr:peptidase S8/S53 domain-containing protein [Lactarius hatsudake]
MRYPWISLLFLLSTLPLGGIVTSPWDDMRSKHSWKTILENWESLGLPTADTMIDLYIALEPYHENALVDALNEVSDPGHDGHPRHVFSTIHSLRMFSRVPLLRYRYVLHGHVQTVAPTAFFSSPVTQWQTLRTRSGVAAVRAGKSPSRRDDAYVTLGFLRWLYSTFAYVPSAMDRKKVGVTGYNQEYPRPVDLTSYMRKYCPDGIDATYVVESVNGGEYDPNNAGREANVNLQLSEGMTYPTPHIFYSTKASPNGDSFLAWLNAVLSKQNVLQTMTTSYGTFENAFLKGYASQVCFLFAQLDARGASVLFASGDDGVGEGDCTARFTPIFPTTCPYVTAVGGTMSFTPEVAASLSGGGFSEYFMGPRYQQQAVSTFLDNLGQQYSGLYNPSWPRHPRYFRAGEDDPDFLQRRGSKHERNKLLGASASLLLLSSLRRPSLSVMLTAKVQIVARIISLLNDYRLSQGKCPLSFLNLWLYGGGLNGLNNIVSGSNPGCNTNGFSAMAGWDPMTGLGTPDFEKLYILDLGSSNPPD